jgi:hypothetical protein
MTSENNIVEARRARAHFKVDELDHAQWERARPVRLAHYWSGEPAPFARQAEARLLWDGEALSARFVCEQREPLCEVFVAPSASDPSRYFEFEVAPTGEWLDLAVRVGVFGRETDWGFYSGMTAAARISDDSFAVAMRVPWDAFGINAAPRAGERWRANLFRCVGAGETRGYIAWLPTRTPEPNFHVPEKFGRLHFAD